MYLRGEAFMWRLFTGCDLVKFHESMESSHGSEERFLSPDLDDYILFEYSLCICPIKLISKLMTNIKTYSKSK